MSLLWVDLVEKVFDVCSIPNLTITLAESESENLVDEDSTDSIQILRRVHQEKRNVCILTSTDNYEVISPFEEKKTVFSQQLH